MITKYKCLVGLSDHTLGVDSEFSANEFEFKMLVEKGNQAK